MSQFWSKVNLQERGLIIFTLLFSVYSSILFVFNHKDIYILVFYFVLVFIVSILVLIGSLILHKLPYLPRIVSPIIGSVFLFAIFGLPAIMAIMLPVFIVSSLTVFTSSKGLLKFVCIAVSLLSASYLVAFYLSSGNKVTKPNVDVVVRDQNQEKESSSKFEVDYFTYGSGTDINRIEYAQDARFVTKSVNAQKLVDNWQGFSGWYRSQYWGFDLTNLPLNAHVWMPKGQGNFPIALIVHGDHAMQDYSEQGYEYLAKSLVKKGYIVVSLDQNFLNRSWSDLLLSYPLQGENDARAWLMLEHLKVWREWTQDEEHPLFGKVDMNNIALMGHSRGGEAASVATAFNQLLHLPEDPDFKFDYQFGIKSVVAIAPVDGTYRPNGKLSQLHDVSYLLLQGTQDGEMNYAGAGQYARTSMDSNNQLHKFAYYIYGANHGQFNSTWGNNDHEFFSPFASRWNLKSLISETEQQNIAIRSISAFLELTLSHKTEYKKKLISPEYITTNTSILVQYADSKTEIIENFHSKNTLATKSNLSQSKLKWIANGSHALLLSWQDCKSSGNCWLDIPLKNSKAYQNILFDFANNTNKLNNLSVGLNFEGNSRDDTTFIKVSEQLNLPPKFNRILKKSLIIPANIDNELAFKTVEFIVPKTVRHKKIESIRLSFSGSGEVYLDNILGIPSR